MGITISVIFMTTILTIIAVGLFTLAKRLIKWGVMTNQALKLLQENRELENLPSKADRFKGLMKWKQKRDSLLDSAESLQRELSEAD